ncbi:hypothetical protein AMECASPLE_032747 [Ameca splendens]|uniref:Uncharacterized protein n=1 Tax=Ameca splendens TaxID=208324 RepID=A0ABV0Z4M0_9TELE
MSFCHVLYVLLESLDLPLIWIQFSMPVSGQFCCPALACNRSIRKHHAVNKSIRQMQSISWNDSSVQKVQRASGQKENTAPSSKCWICPGASSQWPPPDLHLTPFNAGEQRLYSCSLMLSPASLQRRISQNLISATCI